MIEFLEALIRAHKLQGKEPQQIVIHYSMYNQLFNEVTNAPIGVGDKVVLLGVEVTAHGLDRTDITYSKPLEIGIG